MELECFLQPQAPRRQKKIKPVASTIGRPCRAASPRALGELLGSLCFLITLTCAHLAQLQVLLLTIMLILAGNELTYPLPPLGCEDSAIGRCRAVGGGFHGSKVCQLGSRYTFLPSS